jgi:hypothetical protein
VVTSPLTHVSVPGPPLSTSKSEPPSSMSLPAPLLIASLPAPPSILSLPAPVLIASLSLPPQITSLPSLPLMVSLPPRPAMTSSPNVPFRASLPGVPTMVAATPKHSSCPTGGSVKKQSAVIAVSTVPTVISLSPVPYERPYQAVSCRGLLTPLKSSNNLRIVSNAWRKAPLVSSLSGTKLNS